MTPRQQMARMLELCVEASRAEKEHIISAGPEDLIPRVLHASRLGGQFSMMVMVSDHVHPVDMLRDAVPRAISEVGPAAALGFLVEAYMHVEPDPSVVESYERGHFQRLFERGRRENITECVQLFFVYLDGARLLAVMRSDPYHYGDGGVVWGTPTEMWEDDNEGGLEGNVPDILRMAFQVEAN